MMKGEKFLGMRYCGFSDKYAPYKRGMNWHGVHVEGTNRMYRCMCAPMFRLGNDRLGPHGFPKKKAWKNDRQPFKWNIGQHVPGYN